MKITKRDYEQLKNKLDAIEKFLNAGKNNGGGNSYHDELGKFTTGPDTAFGEYKYNPSDPGSVETSPESLGFKPKVESGDSPEYVVDLDDADQERVKKALADAGIEGEDAQIAMDSKISDLEDAIGSDLVRSLQEPKGSVVVESVLPAETVEALIDTTFSMQNLAIDDNEPIGTSAIAERLRESFWGLSSRLTSYGKNIQMLAQWSGASDKTSQELTAGAKKEIEATLSQCDKMVKAMSGTAGNKELEEYFEKKLSAAKAGYNTLKYIEENIDPDAPKLNSLARATSEISDSLDRIIRLAKVKRLEKAIEKLENGGKGSGNFGHSGRPGKVGGSGKSSAGSLAQGRMIKGVREADFKQGIDGGFTVELSSGKSYRLGKSEGYAVGGFGTEKVVDMKDWNDKSKRRKILNDYLKENKKALSQEGACLGGWVPTSGDDKSIIGKVVLDVSRVYKDKKEAAKAAIKTDQDSITDFKGFSWPTKQELAKEFGLEKELKKASGKRQAERNK